MRASAAALLVVVVACVPRDEAEPPELPRAASTRSGGAGSAARSPIGTSSAFYETGRASYYSDKLAGRPTASGERYDPGAMTAAHPRLPFGAIVDVVRADGRAVRVRINDRGPRTPGRVIDLSRRAATELGMIGEGTADVALRVVSLP
jgi:rare lipoprotein A